MVERRSYKPLVGGSSPSPCTVVSGPRKRGRPAVNRTASGGSTRRSPHRPYPCSSADGAPGSGPGGRWFDSSRGCRAPVAQLDRAPDYGSGGQGFEPLQARRGEGAGAGRRSGTGGWRRACGFDASLVHQPPGADPHSALLTPMTEFDSRRGRQNQHDLLRGSTSAPGEPAQPPLTGPPRGESRGCSSTARAPGFQPGDTGSTPVIRSTRHATVSTSPPRATEVDAPCAKRRARSAGSTLAPCAPATTAKVG